MITKRHIYEPLERVESAIERLHKVATDASYIGNFGLHGQLVEIISRDLVGAREKLEYVMEIAE